MFVYQADPNQPHNPYEFPTYLRDEGGRYVFGLVLVYRPEELDFSIRYV